MTTNRLTGRPPIEDNRHKPAAPPIVLEDGRLRCPGEHCRGVLSKITPARCPDCLQALDRPPRRRPVVAIPAVPG